LLALAFRYGDDCSFTRPVKAYTKYPRNTAIISIRTFKKPLEHRRIIGSKDFAAIAIGKHFGKFKKHFRCAAIMSMPGLGGWKIQLKAMNRPRKFAFTGDGFFSASPVRTMGTYKYFFEPICVRHL
jgi:hypothetical protein